MKMGQDGKCIPAISAIVSNLLKNLKQTGASVVLMDRHRRIAKLFFIVLYFSFCATSRSRAQDVEPGKTFRECSYCPEMIVIPAGSFLMGSSEGDTKRDLAAVPGSDNGIFEHIWASEAGVAKTSMEMEHPPHPVTIHQNFALGVFPVTKGEFAAFVRETRHPIAGKCILWDNHRYTQLAEASWQNPGFTQTDRDPVVCVGWDDSVAYIAWLNSKAEREELLPGHKPYRLPSEAEWEYSARAGTQTARWWGDAVGEGNANCLGCGKPLAIKPQTTPIGTFRANFFGLYDMLGNVWQWTEDCWHENYVGAPLDGGPWTDTNCAVRVIRGGGWASSPWVLRSAIRSFSEVNKITNLNGFRVARTIE